MGESDQADVQRFVQVDSASHYHPASYLTPQRLASIGHQIKLLYDGFSPPKTVLEIGVGAGISAELIRRMGYVLSTLDVDQLLKPDILGSVCSIPCDSNQFDCFVCCQVLEHLTWDKARTALKELARVCRLGGVISVPIVEPAGALILRGWGRRGFHVFRLPHFKKLEVEWKQEHYWELGAGVSRAEFGRQLQRSGFVVAQQLRSPYNLYHQFYLVRHIRTA